MQICFLHGHLRQAKAENWTLKNQNILAKAQVEQRTCQLHRAMDVHSRFAEESRKTNRETEAAAHEQYVVCEAAVAAANRQCQQAQKLARDLKASVHST